MGLLNDAYTDITGEVLLRGHETCSSCAVDELRKVRGRDISMIFQDPFACLHPMYRVGDQIAEAVHAHAKRLARAGERAGRRAARARSASRTRRVARATSRTSSRAACASAR